MVDFKKCNHSTEVVKLDWVRFLTRLGMISEILSVGRKLAYITVNPNGLRYMYHPVLFKHCDEVMRLDPFNEREIALKLPLPIARDKSAFYAIPYFSNHFFFLLPTLSYRVCENASHNKFSPELHLQS